MYRFREISKTIICIYKEELMIEFWETKLIMIKCF